MHFVGSALLESLSLWEQRRRPPPAALPSQALTRQLSQRESPWHFAKLYLFARGSPTRGNNDDRRQWRKQGVVVGAAASKTQAKRCGCWVPQPGLGGRKPD